MVSFKPFNRQGAVIDGEISELRIYPIKSCRGIRIPVSYLTLQGLDLDRQWMFADAATRNFITIRDVSEMTLIDTAIETIDTDEGPSDYLRVSIHDTTKAIQIPARPTSEWLQQNTSLLTVSIWGEETDGYVYQDTFSAIFSEYFKRSVVLVYKGPSARIARGNAAPKYLGRQAKTTFPDMMPLQIANEASLRELNQRLKSIDEAQITIERFRPNVVVRNLAGTSLLGPWTEDSWKTVRIIGDPGSYFSMASYIDVDVQARCARCLVPNVNPDTAEKHLKQPWDTLVSYRRVDEGIKFKPCFGMLCVPRQEGRIAVGMKFQVTRTTTEHKYVRGKDA